MKFSIVQNSSIFGFIGLFAEAAKENWEDICGSRPQRALDREWTSKSRFNNEPKEELFWEDNNIKLVAERVQYIQEKTPFIFESILVSVSDKYKNLKLEQDPGFEVRKSKLLSDNTVWCNDYLQKLEEKLKQNEDFVEKMEQEVHGRSKALKYLKIKQLSEQAFNDWKAYNSTLQTALDDNGLDVKTSSIESGFGNIDKNDIKRIKWGLTTFQDYPASLNFDDDQFRSYIRNAANYWMCMTNVIFEEMSELDDKSMKEAHILFTFGTNHMPDSADAGDLSGNLIIGKAVDAANQTYSKSVENREELTTRSFPFWRQNDFTITNNDGLVGKDIYISDQMIFKEGDIEISRPEWFKNDKGRVVVADPTKNADDVDLAYIIAHEIGHALGLDHDDLSTSLMYGIPTNSSMDPYKPFLILKQMTRPTCQKLKKKLPVHWKFVLDTMFSKSTKKFHTYKGVRDSNHIYVTNQRAATCGNLPQPCKCGLDGLKACKASIKRKNKPLNLVSLYNEVKGIKPEESKVTVDSLNCELTISGLKGKLRAGRIPSYPDLYYKILDSTENEIIKAQDDVGDRKKQTWQFKLNFGLESNQELIAQVWDDDIGGYLVDTDDLIAEQKFKVKDFGKIFNVTGYDSDGEDYVNKGVSTIRLDCEPENQWE